MWTGTDNGRLYAFDVRKFSLNSLSAILHPVRAMSPIQILVDHIEKDWQSGHPQISNRPLNINSMRPIRSIRLINGNMLAVLFGEGSLAVFNYFTHEVLSFYQPPFIEGRHLHQFVQFRFRF